MCGILLEFNKRGQFTPNPQFGWMLDEMQHRGKDSRHIVPFETCKVGYLRLAITDVKEGGAAKVGDWSIRLNGEIYNYKELGFEGTESEVLAQGFAKYGCDFVKRLNGMFVIVAICGADVYVFRDRYGQKPFYYFQHKDTLVMASEIKPILEYPDYVFAVNESTKSQWLTFCNVFTNETLFAGIYKMEKGTCWHLNTGQKNKFWEWDFEHTEQIDYTEAKQEVRRLVEQAVRRMTPKEVSFGAFLSGGIDSAIIAKLLPDCPIFTAGYGQGKDERHLAEISGASKSKHYQIVFNQVTDFEQTIYHLEDLRAGASWSNFGLYELASKFCKVIFEGSGSDELFLGYQWRYSEPEYGKIVNRTHCEHGDSYEVFKQVFPKDTPSERFKFDAEHFLEAVLLVGDRMSMAHTIEARNTFLDNDLVDFVLKVPVEYRMGKHILKDAFVDILSPEILNAPKQGWQSPDLFSGNGNQAKKWAENSLQKWFELYNFEV